MSLEKILENWKGYDDRKRKGEDSRYFACSEYWEVDYLIAKIRDVHPDVPPTHINLAIRECCRNVAVPRPRKIFVQCVLQRLSLI